MNVSTYDPLLGFKFRVEIPNLTGSSEDSDLGFMKASGLSADVGVMEYQEISDPITGVKLPDRVKFGDLTLERGFSTATNFKNLWNWFERVMGAMLQGVPSSFRREVYIHCAAKGKDLSKRAEVTSWVVYSAFPKTVKVGDFDASDSGVLLESVVLANEGFMLLDRR